MPHRAGCARAPRGSTSPRPAPSAEGLLRPRSRWRGRVAVAGAQRSMSRRAGVLIQLVQIPSCSTTALPPHHRGHWKPCQANAAAAGAGTVQQQAATLQGRRARTQLQHRMAWPPASMPFSSHNLILTTPNQGQCTTCIALCVDKAEEAGDLWPPLHARTRARPPSR